MFIKWQEKTIPLIKQRDLIAKTKDYSVSNAAKGYLPVFSVNGQATYQSAVTTFPFHVPGITIPQFSKDQYKIYAEADQVIYDGGVIKIRNKLRKQMKWFSSKTSKYNCMLYMIG